MVMGIKKRLVFNKLKRFFMPIFYRIDINISKKPGSD